MLKKRLFIFSILLSSCINLTLKSNEFDTFSDSYTNIFGENPSQVWTDKYSCRSHDPTEIWGDKDSCHACRD